MCSVYWIGKEMLKVLRDNGRDHISLVLYSFYSRTSQKLFFCSRTNLCVVPFNGCHDSGLDRPDRRAPVPAFRSPEVCAVVQLVSAAAAPDAARAAASSSAKAWTASSGWSWNEQVIHHDSRSMDIETKNCLGMQMSMGSSHSTFWFYICRHHQVWQISATTR